MAKNESTKDKVANKSRTKVTKEKVPYNVNPAVLQGQKDAQRNHAAELENSDVTEGPTTEELVANAQKEAKANTKAERQENKENAERLAKQQKANSNS